LLRVGLGKEKRFGECFCEKVFYERERRGVSVRDGSVGLFRQRCFGFASGRFGAGFFGELWFAEFGSAGLSGFGGEGEH
jgi:hypothetical protein